MNHKFFCLFLLYTATTCLISLLLLLIRVVHCGFLMDVETKEELEDVTGRTYEREKDSIDGRHLLSDDRHFSECRNFYSSTFVLGLLVASVVFLVFTCAMGCEQIEAIETGKGKIARMKMKVGLSGTEYSRVTEEFNEMFGGTSPRAAWHWLWPALRSAR